MRPKHRIDSTTPLERCILTNRGHKVVLDTDLSALYGVLTKRLNEQYRRNRRRFPEDFAFQLSAQEWAAVRSQIATSNVEHPPIEDVAPNWSQNATSSQRHRGAAYRPYVFTEHGALMAANILNSPQAITLSVYLIRAFVKVRETLAANVAILKRLAEIDNMLLTQDVALQDIYQRLRPLLAPPPDPAKPEIGFHTGRKNQP